MGADLTENVGIVGMDHHGHPGLVRQQELLRIYFKDLLLPDALFQPCFPQADVLLRLPVMLEPPPEGAPAVQDDDLNTGHGQAVKMTHTERTYPADQVPWPEHDRHDNIVDAPADALMCHM